MAEDLKFEWDHINGVFRNRVSGEAIPKDEPVILFRARDKHAVDVLTHYLRIVEDEHHNKAVARMLNLFLDYRASHPDQMKEPGITHDIDLSDMPEKSPYQISYGDLDGGVVQSLDHTKRGFTPK